MNCRTYLIDRLLIGGGKGEESLTISPIGIKLIFGGCFTPT
jgi:hypothetical protein